MLVVSVRGKLSGFVLHPARPGQKATSSVTIEVRMWRQGASVAAWYVVLLDAYWTERYQKLDDKTKYLSFRCSDIVATVEKGVSGSQEVVTWLKGEEFFL